MQKSDGGFGYAATDLAAVRDRVDNLHADGCSTWWACPRPSTSRWCSPSRAWPAGCPDRVRCEHVTFGNVLGPDRKMFKSRSGETVKLAALLDEAVERADEALQERNTDLDDMARTQLAVQIARAAIKYADLSTDRHHDYIFDLDRMIAFEGDTGPYLQYAHARTSLHLSSSRCAVGPAGSRLRARHAQERHLALGLLAFPEAFESSLASLQPHRLCVYLFDLAQRLTAFYDACPVSPLRARCANSAWRCATSPSGPWRADSRSWASTRRNRCSSPTRHQFSALTRVNLAGRRTH